MPWWQSNVQIGVAVRKGVGGTCPARAAARDLSRAGLLQLLLDLPFPAPTHGPASTLPNAPATSGGSPNCPQAACHSGCPNPYVGKDALGTLMHMLRSKQPCRPPPCSVECRGKISPGPTAHETAQPPSQRLLSHDGCVGHRLPSQYVASQEPPQPPCHHTPSHDGCVGHASPVQGMASLPCQQTSVSLGIASQSAQDGSPDPEQQQPAFSSPSKDACALGSVQSVSCKSSAASNARDGSTSFLPQLDGHGSWQSCGNGLLAQPHPPCGPAAVAVALSSADAAAAGAASCGISTSSAQHPRQQCCAGHTHAGLNAACQPNALQQRAMGNLTSEAASAGQPSSAMQRSWVEGCAFQHEPALHPQPESAADGSAPDASAWASGGHDDAADEAMHDAPASVSAGSHGAAAAEKAAAGLPGSLLQNPGHGDSNQHSQDAKREVVTERRATSLEELAVMPMFGGAATASVASHGLPDGSQDGSGYQYSSQHSEDVRREGGTGHQGLSIEDAADEWDADELLRESHESMYAAMLEGQFTTLHSCCHLNIRHLLIPPDLVRIFSG